MTNSDEPTRDPRHAGKTAASTVGTGGALAALIVAVAPEANPAVAVLGATIVQTIGNAVGSVARDLDHNNGTAMPTWLRVVVKLFASIFG